MSAPAKLDTIGYIVKFFANEQGRDKFNKIIQYGARFLANELKQQDPKSDLAARFTGLFQHTRDTRKLLRWFKQFTELQKIQNLLKQPSSTKQQLQIVGALGLFTYWTYDNLVYLANAKFIDKNANYNKMGMFGWWIGITSALIIDIQSLTENVAKTSKIEQQLSTLSTDTKSTAVNDTSAKLEKERATLKLQQTVLVMNIVKNSGDWLVSFNGFEGPAKLGFAPFSERTVSIAGLISGIIVSYQVYKTL